MTFAIFTKTCARDAERFKTLCATRARFLPGVEHYSTSEDPPADLSAYLWQQYVKLLRPAGGLMLHVDADMWFDSSAAAVVHAHAGLWLYRKALTRAEHAVQEGWARTNSWLLGTEIEPISFMLETRGWWLRGWVRDLLLQRIHAQHNRPLFDLLPVLARRPFSEYQLYASFAHRFAPEAHEWEPSADFPLPKNSALGQDRALFVRHVSSADEIRPEILAHQRKLIDGIA